MASGDHFDKHEQALENEYFNWRCVICCICAESPMHLENQHMVEYGPFKDINGDNWIKCDKCMAAYHVKCLREILPNGKREYICSFFACRN